MRERLRDQPTTEPLREPLVGQTQPRQATTGDEAGAEVPPGEAKPPGTATPEEATPEDPKQDREPAIGLASAWEELQVSIRRRVQPEQFETWFRRSMLTRLDQDVVCITVQNAFSRDWLKTYYAEVLTSAVHDLTGSSPRLEIAVDRELAILPRADLTQADPAGSDPAQTRDATPQRAAVNGAGHSALESSRIPHSPRGGAPAPRRKQESSDDAPISGRNRLVRGSDIGLNPKYTFDNFVVGPCNRFAHAAAVGVAELPGRAYNPLFLHGSVGLGKTHLLQSISYTLLDDWDGVRILFLSCETFVNHFIGALENGDLQKFRNKYRNVDVLVVDDIHLLANKERTQEEFFHTFNTLYNAGKQIVLSSDSPPKDIPTLQERLVSRFKWGLVTELEPPCYETRVAILKRKSRERGLELPEPIAGLVAERVERNIRELEGAVNKLLGYATITNSEIDEDLLRRAMPELFTLRSTQPSTEEIFALVTEGFGVKLSELQSKRRTNAIAYPRQIAMYLARKLTRHSLEEIGGFFGGRDHSTVLYAVDKIDKLMQSDEECRRIVSGFLDRLQSGARS